MVAVWFERDRAREARTGRLQFGGVGGPGIDVDVVVEAVGRRGVVLAAAGAEAEAVKAGGAHAWLEVDLGDATIRPLVELGQGDGDRCPARFKHMFPRDREALDAFHAARATRGY